ncbi:antibiotic biosynthesis monooxygenase [Nocardioides alcanivorans]|uniref:antibiotic biosynthesis monooxygenase n=1 Tax=Nocardioides alcanivorans TaxID=2897352 RepID=UPI001F39002E|nr:antibiotic biosynthesis monooxygenase [Nocardioides alcanivorans]
MFVVNRFRVPVAEAEGFREQLERVQALYAAAPGHLAGGIGRNLDDPELWVLQSAWAGVGAYRRALAGHEAKLLAVPLLSRAIDEPSAFEEVRDGVPLGDLDRVIEGRDPEARGGRRDH